MPGTLSLFTRILEMQGKTIVPGFIDAHSHFPTAGFTGYDTSTDGESCIITNFLKKGI
jgi:imidazolonepropionase-like amidohydrolase